MKSNLKTDPNGLISDNLIPPLPLLGYSSIRRRSQNLNIQTERGIISSSSRKPYKTSPSKQSPQPERLRYKKMLEILLQFYNEFLPCPLLMQVPWPSANFCMPLILFAPVSAHPNKPAASLRICSELRLAKSAT